MNQTDNKQKRRLFFALMTKKHKQEQKYTEVAPGVFIKTFK